MSRARDPLGGSEEEIRMPDPHSTRGRFVGKINRQEVVFHHRTGRAYCLTLREVIEAAARAGGCTPCQVLDRLRDECVRSGSHAQGPLSTPSTPSTPNTPRPPSGSDLTESSDASRSGRAVPAP